MANDDSYQAFKCPSCGQYISNQVDSCRFCSLPLSVENKMRAIENEANDIRQYRRNMHKKILYTGLGTFGIGAVLLIGSLLTLSTGDGFYFPWSPIIVLLGLGQMLIGFLGIIDERKK